MRQVITATCGPMSRRRTLSLALKKRIFNRETGQSFLDNILTRGGSEEPMELFNASVYVSRSWMRCLSITGSKADCYVKICLVDETGAGDGAICSGRPLGSWRHDEENLMALVMTPEHLELRKRDEPKLGGIFVDFVGGAMAHRRKLAAAAVGGCCKSQSASKGSYLPDGVDATAGLGARCVCAGVCQLPRADAGRNLVVAALLDDGLTRGYAELKSALVAGTFYS